MRKGHWDTRLQRRTLRSDPVCGCVSGANQNVLGDRIRELAAAVFGPPDLIAHRI